MHSWEKINDAAEAYLRESATAAQGGSGFRHVSLAEFRT